MGVKRRFGPGIAQANGANRPGFAFATPEML